MYFVLYHSNVKDENILIFSSLFFFANLIQSGLLGGKKNLSQVLLPFQKCFGDVYQFWLGTTHFVVVNGADGVKHIFTHRKIYDHGGILVETGSVLVENSILVFDW